jgi:hypothetical protein
MLTGYYERIEHPGAVFAKERGGVLAGIKKAVRMIAHLFAKESHNATARYEH